MERTLTGSWKFNPYVAHCLSSVIFAVDWKEHVHLIRNPNTSYATDNLVAVLYVTIIQKDSLCPAVPQRNIEENVSGIFVICQAACIFQMHSFSFKTWVMRFLEFGDDVLWRTCHLGT